MNFFTLHIKKRLLAAFFLMFVCVSFSQNKTSVLFSKTIKLKADNCLGIDELNNIYYTKNNTLYKKTKNKTYSYANNQLGTITSVDSTNPLKILVFYRDFNTLVILDNRLNELTDHIHFSTESYGKNVAFASISSNTNLWLYSLDDNILSLWNYKTKQTIFDSQPLSFYKDDFEAISQISNYENCWIYNGKDILKFNEFGSYLTSISLTGISYIKPYQHDFTYLKNNEIYIYKKNSSTRLKLVNNVHFSTNYFVNKNNLYFFKEDSLYKYSILKK